MVSHLAWYPTKHGVPLSMIIPKSMIIPCGMGIPTWRGTQLATRCVRLHRCALDVTMITQAWGLFTNAVDDAKDCGSLCDCAIGTSTYKASSGRT
jgi:hypothetical protein